MDTFMDKLAQKLTAQEMIKANAAADAEELERLQSQVKEYNECLAQMCQVNQEMQVSAGKINQELQAAVGKMSREMQEAAAKMSMEMQAVAGRMSQEAQVVTGRVNQLMEESLVPRITELVEEGVAKLGAAQVDGGKINQQVNQLVEEGIVRLKEIQHDQEALDKLQKSFGELFNQSDEFVHKENVKVYRNVQAVVVEEAEKHKTVLEETAKGLTGRMKLVFGVSIAALACSAAGIVLQLLVYFHII